MRLKILILALMGLTAGVLYFDPSISSNVISRLSSSTDNKIVDDAAKLFTEDEIKYIDSYHRMLLEKFDLDYRVITLNSQQDLNLYSARVFNDQAIGKHSKAHRGLLLVIDVEQDQIRLEVSASLESVYTDSFIAYLENRQMVPFFKVDRVADGIFATAELIRIRAMDAEKGEEFDSAKIIGTIGGGARTDAEIGSGKDRSFEANQPDVMAGDDPKETLRRYLAALSNRNGRNDLDLFTPTSREFMGSLVSTPAQMDNTVKRMKVCEIERITYNDDQTRAVLFHSLAHRNCDPFPFEKGEDGKWRLDLKALGLGTNHTYGNIWYIHYGRHAESEIWKYNFGFRHVYFRRPHSENGRYDHQGIPYYLQYGLAIGHVGKNAIISKVHKDSFMEKNGFKNGDEIVEWEGKEHIHNGMLGHRMKTVRPGLDIHIKIRRNGQLINKFVTAPPFPKKGRFRFGISYGGFPPLINNQPVRYPMVHYVDPQAQGAKLGIEKGDIILQWQDKKMPDVSYLFRWMLDTKSGQKYSVKVYRDGSAVELTSITQPLREMSKVH